MEREQLTVRDFVIARFFILEDLKLAKSQY